MNKTGKVILIGGVVAAIAFGANKALSSANAADKLSIDVDGFAIKEILRKGGIVPLGVVYTITLQLTNPTAKELAVSELNVILKVKTKKGELKQIAVSVPSGQETIIGAHKQTQLKHDIEVRFANVVPILPNFVNYVIDRLRGEKSSQQIIADISLQSMGLTIPLQQIINI